MPRMTFKQVDISSKPVVYREATATGRIRLKSSTLRLIRGGKLEKGDPLSLANLTGILAAKQTPSLLPLCHPLRIEKTEVRTKVGDDSVEVSVTVSAREKTGVEMEALSIFPTSRGTSRRRSYGQADTPSRLGDSYQMMRGCSRRLCKSS